MKRIAHGDAAGRDDAARAIGRGATNLPIRIWMVLVFAVVLVPNAAAMLVPFESWPYTNAPMFAADIAGSNTYRVHLILEGPKERPISGWRDFRITDRHYQRLLLISAYGSMDPDTPFGFVQDDTPAQFAARLDGFFDASFARTDKKRLVGANGMRFALERTDTHETHVVGRYDLRTRTFTLAAR